MKTFWILLCLLHEWRAAVWRSRRANPKLSEDQSVYVWERWGHACEIMEEYHARRHHEIREHMWQLAKAETRP